jgi:hypothetical protein
LAQSNANLIEPLVSLLQQVFHDASVRPYNHNRNLLSYPTWEPRVLQPPPVVPYASDHGWLYPIFHESTLHDGVQAKLLAPYYYD